MSTDLDDPYTVLTLSNHRHQKRKIWLKILTLRWYYIGSPKYKKRVVLQPTQPQLEYPLLMLSAFYRSLIKTTKWVFL